MVRSNITHNLPYSLNCMKGGPVGPNIVQKINQLFVQKALYTATLKSFV